MAQWLSSREYMYFSSTESIVNSSNESRWMMSMDTLLSFQQYLMFSFSLNRPNYARWGTLFLQRLISSDPELRKIPDKGAFSIRRMTKNYSRSVVDISLEQTVNRDTASSMRRVMTYRNSENAMCRWSMTMTQRAMAVTVTFAGLEIIEVGTAQCRPYQVRKDNTKMKALSTKIDEFCIPFADNPPAILVNHVTGWAATKATKVFLLETLQRGQVARETFLSEWENDQKRFLKPVKCVTVSNFASENEKKKKQHKAPAAQTAMKSAQSLRDLFIRMIVVVAENTNFDLNHVLTYPITMYPLALAHSDGEPLKTVKSAFLNKLEEFLTEIERDLPERCVKVYDRGLLIHTTLLMVNVGVTYGSIARTILSVICSGRGHAAHVCLDKYIENSIKYSEWQLCGAVDAIYTITGPDQTMRQRGQTLLRNSTFKNELGKFLLEEWGKDHYWNIYSGKIVFASHGGECLQFIPDAACQQISVTRPPHLQANHEEANTLISFHVANITEETILVRASDTDVLVILIGLLGKQHPEVRSRTKVIMDCGSGSNRRFKNITNITDVLEEKKTGLARALPVYHAFTGCTFTSAFYR